MTNWPYKEWSLSLALDWKQERTNWNVTNKITGSRKIHQMCVCLPIDPRLWATFCSPAQLMVLVVTSVQSFISCAANNYDADISSCHAKLSTITCHVHPLSLLPSTISLLWHIAAFLFLWCIQRMGGGGFYFFIFIMQITSYYFFCFFELVSFKILVLMEPTSLNSSQTHSCFIPSANVEMWRY